MDPEIEWEVAFRLPDLPLDKDVYRGHDELRMLWGAFTEVWDTLTIELEEVVHDADDVLITRNRFVGRGSGSGIEVDRVLYYLLDMRNGKLRRVRPFESEAEARAAAGLNDG